MRTSSDTKLDEGIKYVLWKETLKSRILISKRAVHNAICIVVAMSLRFIQKHNQGAISKEMNQVEKWAHASMLPFHIFVDM